MYEKYCHLDKYGKKVQLYMQMRVRHRTGMFGSAKSVANHMKFFHTKNIYICTYGIRHKHFDYMR